MNPIARAFGQLGDPAVLGVVGRSLLVSLIAFVAAIWGAAHLIEHAAHLTGWLAGLLAGVLGAILAFYLFVPLAGLIAAQFTQTVIRAVERRWYPDLPPPARATWTWQLVEGLRLALRLALCNLAGLVATLLLPGPGLLVGWAASAYGLGPGLFMLVATRRMDRPTARAALAAHRGPILLQGGIIALIGLVPVLNLLLPILGLAVMVHVLDEAMLGPPTKQGF